MKISVIIPTYNRACFIAKAIDSVLAQTYLADEIIVVDDGSIDDTKKVLSTYDNIHVLYQTNSGVSCARNTGIKHAKNDWIAFLDSDDTWNDNKLEEQVNFHTLNPNIFISHTDELWIRNGKTIHQKKHQKKPSGFCFFDNISTCKIGPSTTMIHKSLFDDVGLFDESLSVCEDYDLWLRVSRKYEIGYVDLKLIIKYAGHKNQLSFNTFAIDTYRIKALEKHLDEEYLIEVKEEITKKSLLLIKGAKKHKNIAIEKEYEQKILLLNNIR